jgi:2-keto-4-pentenoate hydratase/2-oxohepta-3-ene-1,7-dioic acid hydratase in catechol pathway
LKVARIADPSTESYILINKNEAILRDEIVSQLGIHLPNTLEEFLLSEFAQKIEHSELKLKFTHSLNNFEFLSPISNPPKIIFLNFNYKDQSGWIRFGKNSPREPVFYLKPRTCLNRPFGNIISPEFVTQLDFEGEMAVVIGKKCKNISESDAAISICGYMVMNDVSARDIQYTDIQVSRSKCFDTFAPCGPWITTSADVKDPNDLRVVTKVNGEVRQDSLTSNMVLRVEEIISKLSKVMTLEPGDIISTGTPMGTILSSHGTKPWLRNDDLIEVEVEGLGSIRNKVHFESQSVRL